MRNDIIKYFRGYYRPLSNMYDNNIVVEYEGLVYNSSEAAYQSAKTLDMKKRKLFTTTNPILAKRMGGRLIMRPDWDDIKLEVMYDVVRDKFYRNIEMQEFLIKTFPKYIEENNYWGDTFWGVCDEEGENNLGRILMKVRDEIMNIGADV